MTDFCPKCQTLRELRIGSVEEKSMEEDPNKKKIIRGYFCSACNTFLKSEEVEVSDNTRS